MSDYRIEVTELRTKWREDEYGIGFRVTGTFVPTGEPGDASEVASEIASWFLDGDQAPTFTVEKWEEDKDHPCGVLLAVDLIDDGIKSERSAIAIWLRSIGHLELAQAVASGNHLIRDDNDDEPLPASFAVHLTQMADAWDRSDYPLAAAAARSLRNWVETASFGDDYEVIASTPTSPCPWGCQTAKETP